MFTGFFKDPLDFPLPLGFNMDRIFPSAGFPTLFSPRRRTNSKSGGTKKVPGTSTKVFKVMFDVKQFHKDEVTVAVEVVEEGTVVEVHAKHVERADEHGFISREFTRRHKLPSDVNPKELHATMSHNGILVISVPFKVQDPASNERLVPMNLADPSMAAIGPLIPQKMPVEVPFTQKLEFKHATSREN